LKKLPAPDESAATPAQLADATHVTRAAMTSRLDRLVAAGLVTWETDHTDRRRVLIRPTAAGRTAWDKYIFAEMERDRRLLDALTPTSSCSSTRCSGRSPHRWKIGRSARDDSRPQNSRWSESARLGTAKDRRKTGRMLFPLQRKLTISPSAASKVLVRLEFRPLRNFRA
jgi:DNA-binding MarR family transcriptional regulator